LGLLAEHLAARLEAAGVEIRCGAHVEGLRPRPGGWSVSAISGGATEHTRCQAIVLAVPAAPSARLLAPLAPAAAEVLGALDYASVALVTLALPREEMADLTGSGFLVPPGEEITIKASTFSAVKWSWVGAAAPDLAVVRASFGRAGESEVLRGDDAALVRLARRDLGHVLGAALPAHIDARVHRWESSLPQYAVGHLDRVAAVRDAIRGLPGLALAGAAYDGVGIPACIGSGRAAAQAVLDHLSATQTHRGESAV
ncbi:MAG TPA: protoporphyrinogen oxidase, partial [Candidatus Lustribacter sp.]|nr:protoporphyrinogen oxidase [Candidatus Lustribacter sp.]